MARGANRLFLYADSRCKNTSCETSPDNGITAYRRSRYYTSVRYSSSVSERTYTSARSFRPANERSLGNTMWYPKYERYVCVPLSFFGWNCVRARLCATKDQERVACAERARVLTLSRAHALPQEKTSLPASPHPPPAPLTRACIRADRAPTEHCHSTDLRSRATTPHWSFDTPKLHGHALIISVHNGNLHYSGSDQETGIIGKNATIFLIFTIVFSILQWEVRSFWGGCSFFIYLLGHWKIILWNLSRSTSS